VTVERIRRGVAIPETIQEQLPPIRIQQFAFPLALLTMIVIGSLAYPQFHTSANVRNVLTFASIPLIVALGQTVVVLARGADLSVGSMIALSGAVLGVLFVNKGLPLALTFAICIGLGLALGAIANGVTITKLRVSFIIVTLGTFSIFRSLADVVINGTSISVYNPTLDWMTNGQIGSIPVLIVTAALFYLLMLFVLRGTTFGRAVYAVGANPEAARLSGIPVHRVVIAAYAICGGLAAFAGILTVGQLGSAQPTAGVTAELNSLAAVLLGGTRFSGGHGGVTGTVMGVLFLGTLANLLLIAGVNSFWQGTASGLVLITAVALDRTRRD
jgi:ribose transport system permease protein